MSWNVRFAKFEDSSRFVWESRGGPRFERKEARGVAASRVPGKGWSPQPEFSRRKDASHVEYAMESAGPTHAVRSGGVGRGKPGASPGHAADHPAAIDFADARAGCAEEPADFADPGQG